MEPYQTHWRYMRGQRSGGGCAPKYWKRRTKFTKLLPLNYIHPKVAAFSSRISLHDSELVILFRFLGQPVTPESGPGMERLWV